MTDHLARAKDYLVEADRYEDKGEELKQKAADCRRKAGQEIATWLAEDTSRTQADAAALMDIGTATVHRLYIARETGEVDWGSGSNRRDEVTRKVLRDPDQRRQIIESLKPDEVEDLIGEANEVAVERARTRRTEPTAAELTSERFDPSEFWADTLIIRIHRNARELESLLRRGGGLRLGTMPVDEAFEYLQDAEKLIAEARAAAQEQAREAVA